MSDTAAPATNAEAPAANTQLKESGGQLTGAAPIPGAPQAGDVSSAAAEAMRKYRVKVEGKELEVDEKELLRGYGHQRAASRMMNEAKAERSKAEKALQMLNDDEQLETILKKMGKDPRKLAEKILSKHLEDELMDPRDKELRDAKAKLKHLEDMETKQKEEIAKRRLDEVKARFMKEYETDFVAALDESGLPPTKPMVAEMAKYISRSAKIGFKMSAKEAAQLVKEDIQLAHQRLIGDADGDKLIALLGEGVANKVRKYDTGKLKSPEAQLRTPAEQAVERRDRGQPKKRMTSKEWRLHKMGLK